MKQKKVIKLTEADLHKIVRKSVNNLLKESGQINEIAPLLAAGAKALASNALRSGVAQNIAGGLGNITGGVAKAADNVLSTINPVYALLKGLLGGSKGQAVHNELNQAVQALTALQKSGILQIDQNANASVQQCLRSLQNIGKQTQQFEQQMQQQQQQGQAGQQQGQGNAQQQQGQAGQQQQGQAGQTSAASSATPSSNQTSQPSASTQEPSQPSAPQASAEQGQTLPSPKTEGRKARRVMRGSY